MAKRALITGITGQDGAYLARLLLEKGYEVYGAARRNASGHSGRLKELGVYDHVREMDLEMLEYSNIHRTLEKAKPDEIYNLAAQSFVGASFEQPIYTAEVDALGTLRVLEAMRSAIPTCRFYQASTSEMFGKVQETPQKESTPFYPRSPYGVAKLFAHWATVNYRESYNLYACSGILFNHESPLRGREFVTRKITSQLAEVRYGQREVVELGNMNSSRDWGFAGDYVRGMWLMLQQETPDDYILATGETHTVRQFVHYAMEACGFIPEWEGEGERECVRDKRTGKVVVRVNPKFYRPAEVDLLVGNASKAKQQLGWATETKFEELVRMMAEADIHRASEGRLAYAA